VYHNFLSEDEILHVLDLVETQVGGRRSSSSSSREGPSSLQQQQSAAAAPAGKGPAACSISPSAW
jgi:hypothetical protein